MKNTYNILTEMNGIRIDFYCRSLIFNSQNMQNVIKDRFQVFTQISKHNDLCDLEDCPCHLMIYEEDDDKAYQSEHQDNAKGKKKEQKRNCITKMVQS